MCLREVRRLLTKVQLERFRESQEDPKGELRLGETLGSR